MKKFSILLLGLSLFALPANAQSWGDMLNGLLGSETTSQPEVKVEYPTAKQIVGKWVYQQLDLD